ncbi:MAG: bifunctional transaldolase/phosoglucose isomerase [Pyrinomonadaceae bacterium]
MMRYSLPVELNDLLAAEAKEWEAGDRISRLWKKDASLWTGDDEAKWLGWLNIVDEELETLDKYRELKEDVQSGNFSDVLLMGMGGSSLAPEVLAVTFGKSNFHILDSTVPAQVRSVEAKLDVARTLFIVASKSGSTLEPNCFKQYFYERLVQVVGRDNAGKQFIAITDPGSKMERVAKGDGFRRIFHGKPDIGGRFSALTPFGMAAAAAMGLDVEKFLRSAKAMASACQVQDPIDNPGALLGLLLGVAHRSGRDKLTIFTSPAVYDLGAWLEQLVAESTGKDGISIIPVDREPRQQPKSYGNDRVFVFVGLADEGIDSAHASFSDYGHPSVYIELPSAGTLGQEFFRWEFATAVAGAVMGINPFNQPDVESAKIEARKLTDEYERTGELPTEEAFYHDNGISLFSGAAYTERLKASTSECTLRAVIDAHFDQIGKNDYFALLAYVEMNDKNEAALTSIRERVLLRTGAATCLGFGPRFLHSTGQAYKGGANNGVFLQITSDDAIDLAIPGQKYSFGVIKAAQARGDFHVLIDRGRRALRIHLGADIDDGLERLVSFLAQRII